MAQTANENVTRYLQQVPAYLRPLASANWQDKLQALESMVKQGKAATQPLIEGLQLASALDRDTQSRPPVFAREIGRHCAIALGRIADPAAVPTLIRALNYPDRDTRREIISALGVLKEDSAIKPLCRLWEDGTEDKTNKREAAIALIAVGAKAASAIADTHIVGEQERLAVGSLLKIALRDREAVERIAHGAATPQTRQRATAALQELDIRRKKWPNRPPIDQIRRETAQLLQEHESIKALESWETVLDSGCYAPEVDDEARTHMLEIKSHGDASLYPKPLATWRNKIFILARYDAQLPDNTLGGARHVAYELTPVEIENLRKRFAIVSDCIKKGSCGALAVENDITVVQDPWKIFNPSIRTGQLSAMRAQISRADLDSVFHYKSEYLDKGTDCVFFVMRSDGKTFEIDGGAAGGYSVLNAQRDAFSDLDITAHCHELLHIIHTRVWERGGFDWLQCTPLHEQIRELRLRASWQTGRDVRQSEVFVQCMQKYITARMWRSLGDREKTAETLGTSHD